MFLLESFSIKAGFWAGQIKLTSVAPSLRRAISSSEGALTLRISGQAQISSREPIVAPAAV
ncbi:Uncharacterised protein [Vibrio cholerae]|uniref:Uncharacterized protein n=1 Tax=Vibrio cholerae TaxID=666 RepID=A0A655RLV8_VIBCL|nr:Uncharacterised protein [Vibrio cholerae]CSC43310.1 Uncharacterised protein [Vibrio cholerae]